LVPANNSFTDLISLEDMLRDKRSTTTYAARPIGMTSNGVRAATRYIEATIDTPANNGPLRSRNRIEWPILLWIIKIRATHWVIAPQRTASAAPAIPNAG